MAFTVSSIVRDGGASRLGTFVITPDAATGVVTIPGAVAIDGIVAFSLKSGTSLSCVNVAQNANASGTAALGVVGFSNVVANQTYFLTVLYH